MMNSTSLAIFAILAAMALVGVSATYIFIPADAALDDRYGRCKNQNPPNAADQACKNAKGD